MTVPTIQQRRLNLLIHRPRTRLLYKIIRTIEPCTRKALAISMTSNVGTLQHMLAALMDSGFVKEDGALKHGAALLVTCRPISELETHGDHNITRLDQDVQHVPHNVTRHKLSASLGNVGSVDRTQGTSNKKKSRRFGTTALNNASITQDNDPAKTRDRLRAALARDTKAFLASGHKVEVLPPAGHGFTGPTSRKVGIGSGGRQ